MKDHQHTSRFQLLGYQNIQSMISEKDGPVDGLEIMKQRDGVHASKDFQICFLKSLTLCQLAKFQTYSLEDSANSSLKCRAFSPEREKA